MRQKVVLLIVSWGTIHNLSAQTPTDINLNWIDTKPIFANAGVSWGLPFSRGMIKPDQSFTITNFSPNCKNE